MVDFTKAALTLEVNLDDKWDSSELRMVKEALEQAYNQGIEDAAKVSDRHGDVMIIREQIRALCVQP